MTEFVCNGGYVLIGRRFLKRRHGSGSVQTKREKIARARILTLAGSPQGKSSPIVDDFAEFDEIADDSGCFA